MLSNDRPIGVIQVEVASKFFWGWRARELPVPGALFSGQKFDWHTVPAPLLLAKVLSFASFPALRLFGGFSFAKVRSKSSPFSEGFSEARPSCPISIPKAPQRYLLTGFSAPFRLDTEFRPRLGRRPQRWQTPPTDCRLTSPQPGPYAGGSPPTPDRSGVYKSSPLHRHPSGDC